MVLHLPQESQAAVCRGGGMSFERVAFPVSKTSRSILIIALGLHPARQRCRASSPMMPTLGRVIHRWLLATRLRVKGNSTCSLSCLVHCVCQAFQQVDHYTSVLCVSSCRPADGCHQNTVMSPAEPGAGAQYSTPGALQVYVLPLVEVCSADGIPRLMQQLLKPQPSHRSLGL